MQFAVADEHDPHNDAIGRQGKCRERLDSLSLRERPDG